MQRVIHDQLMTSVEDDGFQAYWTPATTESDSYARLHRLVLWGQHRPYRYNATIAEISLVGSHEVEFLSKAGSKRFIARRWKVELNVEDNMTGRYWRCFKSLRRAKAAVVEEVSMRLLEKQITSFSYR